LTEVLGGITAEVERVLAAVHEIAATVESVAARARAGGDALVRDDLAVVRTWAAGVLTGHVGLLAGAGVVLAPGVLSDVPRWIEWWWRGASGPERLRVDLDPESAEFMDYTLMEWYCRSEQTGQWTITGPYVDYICTHEYTFTLSAPLYCAGRFLGVAGADILAAQVERLVLPDLARVKRDAIVVSAAGRVIASNTARVLPGELAPPGEVIAATAILPWRVLGLFG
jgi:methyl-accepting chemotaxis protein-like sensor